MSKMGRPKIELDQHQLTELMKLIPSLEETASFFNVSDDTIHKRIKEIDGSTFKEFREKHAVHTRLSIKRKMIQKAIAGDNTMLIWLSKNMLGMADKQELKAEVSTPDESQAKAKLDQLKSLLKEST